MKDDFLSQNVPEELAGTRVTLKNVVPTWQGVYAQPTGPVNDVALRMQRTCVDTPLPARSFARPGGRGGHSEGPRLPNKVLELPPAPLAGDVLPAFQASQIAVPLGNHCDAPVALAAEVTCRSGSDQYAMETIHADRIIWDDGTVSGIMQEAMPRDDDQVQIPSDEDRPRPPHPSKAAHPQLVDDALSHEEELAPLALQALRDEEEWLARKRLTGTVGRLVRYKEGQRPADDILGLCLTRTGRIMVTALQEDGPASRAGVTAGDQLASINGERTFRKGPAKSILANVLAPATIVFLGFAGKLQAEVRVRQPDQPRCGLPAATEIVLNHSGRTSSRLRLTEAVIFQTRISSLFIATMSPPEADLGLVSSVEPETGSEQATCTIVRAPEVGETEPGLYELQREDARRVLKRALRITQQKPSLCTV